MVALWQAFQNQFGDQPQPGAAQADVITNDPFRQGYADRNQQIGQQMAQAQKPAPYASQTNDLVNYLSRAAQGQGPSLAQQQYQQAADAGMRQQLAMAAGARPSDAANAARAAAQNIGTINQGLGSGLAQAGIQERMGAAGQLTGAIGMGNQQFNAQNDYWARLQQLAMQNAQQQQQGGFQQQALDIQRAGQPTGTDKTLSTLASLAPLAAM